MLLCQGNERRFQIACRIVERFRKQLPVPQAAFGFSVFTADGASPIAWEIPIVVSDRPVVRGSISLALNSILDQLLMNKDCVPLKKRVFLITDGLSKNDGMTEVANRCITSRVIVDGVILSERFPMVAALCMVTGGYAFNHRLCPIDEEEFVDLNLRRTASNLTQVDQRLLISMRDTLTFSSGLSFADPLPQTEFVSEFPPPLSSDYRLKRISNEFFRCKRFQKVLVFQTCRSADIWRVFLSALDVLWDLAVTFPPDYPAAPPLFRFIAKPGGVPRSGRVRLPRYHPRMRIVEMLEAIRRGIVEWDDAGWRERVATFELDPGKPFPFPSAEYVRMVGGEATEGEQAAEVPGVYSRISWERTPDGADVVGIDVTPRERALLAGFVIEE
jgi:hypothetical protein